MLNGHWTDLISDFTLYTESSGAFTPPIFRKWAAISLIAGACARRIWVRVGPRITFPNQYIMLVASPGIGKYIIEDEVRALWRETLDPVTGHPAIHTGPDNVTKAALIDTLADCQTVVLPKEGPPITFHSLCLAAEEFEVLLPSYDTEFIATLNSIWNNKDSHQERRRYGKATDITIEKPQLNLLAGAQPSYFVSHFPEHAWNTGFCRRIIMIYQSEAPLLDPFTEPVNTDLLRKKILHRLGLITMLYGQMTWSLEGLNTIREWHLAGGPPAPIHSKLAHYNRSRTQFVVKLAMVSAVSRSGELRIDPEDSQRAIDWLLEAEEHMPGIFREMVGRSDWQIIEELWYFVQNLYTSTRGKTIHGNSIARFLATRLPSDRVDKVWKMAEASNVVARKGGTENEWIPRPRHQHGLE